MYTKIKLIYLLVLLLNSTICLSQNSIEGSVFNLSTNETVSDAFLHFKKDTNSTFSDYNGYYNLKLQGLDITNSDSIDIIFYCNNNMLYWKTNSICDLSIYNLEGKNIAKLKQVSTSGSFQLRTSNSNLYIIHVESPKGNCSVKINTCIPQFYSPNIKLKQEIVKNILDTLIIEHDEYFTQEIPINRDLDYMRYFNIKLVKKENEQIDFLNNVPQKEAWNLIKNLPTKTYLGYVESIKVLIDSNTDQVYFLNSNIHKLHYSFAKEFLGYDKSQSLFNKEQYTNNPKRHYFPITLNYFPEIDTYTFEFFSGDGATCEQVEYCYDLILSHSYFSDKLFFYSTNDSWINCNETPRISPNTLFSGQNYQALNTAETYGYLKKIENSEIASTNLNSHDIILTNGIPIEIAVVSGIITTEFQTPLSHINVLSHNRGTPNMALIDGFTNPILDTLLNELVYLQVASDSFYIRKATLSEANTFWEAHKKINQIDLNKNTLIQGLVDLDTAKLSDVNSIGGKAANFSELIRAFKSNNMQAAVPEDYFAIPFYYYEQHLKTYGLDVYIQNMLASDDFKNNADVRRQMLQTLQDSIIRCALSQELIDLVTAKLNTSQKYTSFKFRSSTNAEDIEGFNGAGLYSSFKGELNNNNKPIDVAIKSVWASLWYFKAYDEREYFLINQNTCAMGVLVHRSFSDELANGVAITTNPYNSNPAYIINTQYNEVSVVNPPSGVINEQIILWNFSISGTDKYTVEYTTHSNLKSADDRVLTKDELMLLGDYIKKIKDYYYYNFNPSGIEKSKLNLDIEFKIDNISNSRVLYIKQVRTY